MKIFVTGVAGFIGSRVAELLLIRGDNVVGIDNLNDYYDIELKKARLKRIQNSALLGEFAFIQMDTMDNSAISELFEKERFDKVVHMAAQDGDRYSIEKPLNYVGNNVVGFAHVLEGCRQNCIQHLVYASSSSIYGLNRLLPFSVHQNSDHPLSLYAALKKSNELMAHSYSHLYQIPTTGLRFCTVYGPWDNPNMALTKFTKAILAGKSIDVYNQGKHLRDFTYIDDVAEAVILALDTIAEPNKHWNPELPDPASSSAPWRIYNIGDQHPTTLMTYIETLEKHLGQKALKNYMNIQPGDVQDTYADIDAFIGQVGFEPKVSIDEGIKAFVQWYKEYYHSVDS